jgi:GNAT superfamily N-acetyltransferase
VGGTPRDEGTVEPFPPQKGGRVSSASPVLLTNHSPNSSGDHRLSKDSRVRLRFVVTVTELKPGEVATVDRHLPLSRLCQQVEEHSTYLIAWEDDQPIGHAHIAWRGTHLELPEIQDVFVLPEKRRRGIATQLTHAAEEEARARGWNSISLSVSQEGNAAARLLYTKLGYIDAGADPVRVTGPIMLRGRRFDVDDTLVYLTKHL